MAANTRSLSRCKQSYSLQSLPQDLSGSPLHQIPAVVPKPRERWRTVQPMFFGTQHSSFLLPSQEFVRGGAAAGPVRRPGSTYQSVVDICASSASKHQPSIQVSAGKHWGDLSNLGIRSQGWLLRLALAGQTMCSARVGKKQPVRDMSTGAGDTSDPGSTSESMSGGDAQSNHPDSDTTRFEKDVMSILKDRGFSVNVDRRDPWASTSDSDGKPPSGEVSSEAVSVLGGASAGASFPMSHFAHSSDMGGSDDAPIKVQVPVQDASITGIEVLRLLTQLEEKKLAEKAQANQTWWRALTYETGSFLLFVFSWLQRIALASFGFLVKQPRELFNLSWPGPRETLSTMGLVTGTIAVLLVLISTMDTGFTFMLASLVRRSAK